MAKSTKDRVIQMVADNMGRKAFEIKETHNLITDLEMDELDTVELVMALEDEFRVPISDEDADKFKTVQDIITYMENKVA